MSHMFHVDFCRVYFGVFFDRTSNPLAVLKSLDFVCLVGWLFRGLACDQVNRVSCAHFHLGFQVSSYWIIFVDETFFDPPKTDDWNTQSSSNCLCDFNTGDNPSISFHRP